MGMVVAGYTVSGLLCSGRSTVVSETGRRGAKSG